MTNLCLNDVRHTSLSSLKPAQFFIIELNNFMQDIRTSANAAKRDPAAGDAFMVAHLRYLTGRLHGLIFGFSSLLIYGTDDYDEVGELIQAASNEATFLCYEYLEGATS